jgi:undecaprenyl-diphosphatase
MLWEQHLLLWIHAHGTPFLDRFFVLTEPLGKIWVFTTMVVALVIWHVLHKQRREARAWALIGIFILCVSHFVKPAVARARPDLWLPLVVEKSYSFPSGHALGTAAFYPLLAFTLVPAASRRKSLWMSLAVLASLIVGFARLYLGVHWPTDVLGGWAIGFTASATAIAWLQRSESA